MSSEAHQRCASAVLAAKAPGRMIDHFAQSLNDHENQTLRRVYYYYKEKKLNYKKLKKIPYPATTRVTLGK